MSEPALLQENVAPSPDPRCGKYVIFRIARHEFGTAVDHVLEVIEAAQITAVPNSPASVAGVINLRGKVIPIVDLRRAFALSTEAVVSPSCIMIVRATLAHEEQVLGIGVDEVVEVMSLQSEHFLNSEEIWNIPRFGSHDPAPYLVGIVRVEERIKLLLDLDGVLNNLELDEPESISRAA